MSQLVLGTMNFGQPGRGHQGDWTLGIDEARPIFRAAIERGLYTFDCADVYGLGACEEVVGALLRELLPRDEYVLATKISMPLGPGPNQGGLSRKHVREAIDASLRRLGLDYIDHLVIHRHPHGVPGHVAAPIEETLEALHDAVKAGKVLYLGGSSMFAWQFAELQLTARMNGWTRFVSMQNHHNLIYREEEREMNPYCISSGVALMPWSPLARGILAGSYRGGFDGGSTTRSSGMDRVRTEGLYRGEADFAIADRVVLLHGGRVEQAGAPTELYGAPRTLYGATFLGSASTIPVSVAGDRSAAQAQVSAGGTAFVASRRAEASLGNDATVVIRVECVRVLDGDATPPPGGTVLDLAVRTSLYLGERWEHAFTLGDATLRAWGGSPLVAGRTYRVWIPIEGAWAF